MNKTDVVLDKAVKTNQDTAIILKPGKPSLHFPAPSVTAEFSPILRLLLLAVGAMRRYQFHAIFSQLLVQRIAVKRSGSSAVNMVFKVGSTRVISCGEALLTDMATGRPERSATAMIFVPLPRLVFPTPWPPFLR